MDLKIYKNNFQDQEKLQCGQMMHLWVYVWLIVFFLMIMNSILNICDTYSLFGYSTVSTMVVEIILLDLEEIFLFLCINSQESRKIIQKEEIDSIMGMDL